MARLTLVVLLLSLAVPAHAESLFGASFFGGDVRTADARVEGRGGMGLAYRDSLSASVRVATQLVDIPLVTVTLTGNYAASSSTDDFGTVRRYGLNVPTIRVAAPLGRRAGFGFGYEAQRATQWTIVRPYAQDASIQETLDREGTQFNIPFEFGFAVNRHLRLGAGLLLERGTIRQRYLAELSGGGIDPFETREETLRSTTFRVSVAVHEVGPLSMAGYFMPERDGEVSIRVRGVALDNREDTERTETRPLRWGVGGRIELPRRWSVGMDVENELWTSYQGRRFLTEVGNPASEVFLQDELTLRGGLEREVRDRDDGRPLRLGAMWRRWNYQLEGVDVTEWGVTLGTGLFFNAPGARADLAIGYHRIAAEGGPHESTFRLVFSVTGGERWY